MFAGRTPYAEGVETSEKQQQEETKHSENQSNCGRVHERAGAGGDAQCPQKISRTCTESKRPRGTRIRRQRNGTANCAESFRR
jgi:hypothetical protein